MELVLPPEKRILAAFSGGADSTAMLCLLQQAKLDGRVESVSAAHFNHHLRPEADADERHVESFCRERGIECLFGGADVAALAAQAGRGIEETARDLRYAFLEEAANRVGAEVICTAHNAGDNVETVLLNLARGAGLSGLRGIPRRRGNIFRPILHATRDEIIGYLNDSGLSYVEDASNTDTKYRRNLIRHEVIPQLKRINPRLERSVEQMTGLLRLDEEFFELAVNDALRHAEKLPDGISYDAEKLKALHPSVAARVCGALCERAGLESMGYDHIESVLRLARSEKPGAGIELPMGLRAVRRYGRLIVGRPETELYMPELAVELMPPGFANYKYSKKIPSVFYINADSLGEGLAVRRRAVGDKIALAGHSGTKSLKKLFIDEKVPRVLRDTVPVVADDRGIIAVYGFGVDRSRAVVPEARILRLTLEKTGMDENHTADSYEKDRL